MDMMNSDRTCTGTRDRYSPLAIQVTRATGLQRPTMPGEGIQGRTGKVCRGGYHQGICSGTVYTE